MFDTIAKWWSPEILQLCDAKNPLHLEVFWNHIDSDPGFWNPRKTHITNDDGWKIHHEWRCISYWNMGDFSNVMLVFQGCINFHAHFFAVVGRHFSISKPGAMSYGSISMEVRPFFFLREGVWVSPCGSLQHPKKIHRFFNETSSHQFLRVLHINMVSFLGMSPSWLWESHLLVLSGENIHGIYSWKLTQHEVASS